MTTSLTVVPRLVLPGADKAIDFYRRALGAELLSRFTDPAGTVVHADLRIGSSMVSVKDEDDVDRSARTLGGTPVLFTLEVDDAYAVAGALEKEGATVVFAVSDSAYGYRQGRLEDPFGLQWMVSQRIEELDDATTQERLDVELR